MFIILIFLFILLALNLLFVFTKIFPGKIKNSKDSLSSKKNKKYTSIGRKQIPSTPISPESHSEERSKKLEKKKLKKLKMAPLKEPEEKELKLKGKGVNGGLEYLSKEDIDLGIPAIPLAPKKIVKISTESPGLSIEILDKVKNMESKDTEVVLVNCERCDEVIPVPVPKSAVLKSELPIVPISYIHKNKHDKDQHCITIHVDHDFDIRRQRISEVIIS